MDMFIHVHVYIHCMYRCVYRAFPRPVWSSGTVLYKLFLLCNATRIFMSIVQIVLEEIYYIYSGTSVDVDNFPYNLRTADKLPAPDSRLLYKFTSESGQAGNHIHPPVAIIFSLHMPLVLLYTLYHTGGLCLYHVAIILSLALRLIKRVISALNLACPYTMYNPSFAYLPDVTRDGHSSPILVAIKINYSFRLLPASLSHKSWTS